MWLAFSRRCLLEVLQDHPAAVIRLPTRAEVKTFARAIGNKYTDLGRFGHRVWAACDGLKLPLQQANNFEEQNPYWNGWKQHCFINGVLIFSPDGLVRSVVGNCPGAWHDSKIANCGIYDDIELVYRRTGAKVVVDSAFKKSASMLNKSKQMVDDKDCAREQSEDELVNAAATSVRQLSEWGMRMIQGQFPRVKDNMIYETRGERQLILQLLVLLYNYQTSKIGINTILNTFMPRTKGFKVYKKGRAYVWRNG